MIKMNKLYSTRYQNSIKHTVFVRRAWHVFIKVKNRDKTIVTVYSNDYSIIIVFFKMYLGLTLANLVSKDTWFVTDHACLVNTELHVN